MQYLFTPAAGKRLIGKAVADMLMKDTAMHAGTIVIIAGTTNGYIAEELLRLLNQTEGFSRRNFLRGITLPPGKKTTEQGRLPDESDFCGDIVLEKGIWQKGKTIFDVVDSLKCGDIIVKGANCVNLVQNKAGILIGHPKGGTIMTALQAVIGRRAKLILPVGLEKRIFDDIDATAQLMNAPTGTGLRLLPVQGDIITELEALRHLFGVSAKLVAAGGVCGAEGAVWIYIDHKNANVNLLKETVEPVLLEERF